MIRELARELYRLQQEVDRLEGRVRTASPAEKERIEEDLRRLRPELDRLRKILEAKKEGPPIRKPM
jgi:predicted nuclease with TOPRIM domain